MTDERVAARAELTADEKRAGSDNPERQAEVILAESDARSLDRNAAPGSVVEKRTSEETVPPID